ncbi:MAG: methyl-accepting chemotaxis protein [Oceanospirillales bacterium]|nr:methyl-accepting chemotaxis protein [Oceanospirillales bacterium]
MKIKQKLILAFVANTLLASVLLSLFSISQSREAAQERFAEISALQLQTVDDSFSAFFRDIGRDIEHLAKAPILRQVDDSIKTYYDQPEQQMTPTKNGGLEADIYRHLERFGSTHPGFNYVYIGTEMGGYVQWPESKMTADYDPRKRPWYMTTKAKPDAILFGDSYYWAGDDITLVPVSHTFRDSNGKLLGVLSADVSLASLTDMAQQVKLGEKGFLILVEDTGKVLVDASNPDNNFKNLADLSGSAYQQLDKASSGLLQLTLNGEEYEARVHQSDELGWKLVALMPRSEIMAPAQELMWTTLGITALVLLAVCALAFWLSGMLVKPILMVSKGLKEIAQGGGDLRGRLSVVSRDEAGDLATWFNQFLDSLQGLVTQVNQSAHEVASVSAQAQSSAAAVDRASEHQLREVESMVAAVNEMSATASEVARSCAQTADAAGASQEASDSGKRIMASTESSVRQLGEQVAQSVNYIGELEQETGQINTILEVIRGIAEQTNLLALNAAIEAARAGDSGRGFAVVADEVRTLAQRTQVSTEEIGALLERLNVRTKQVVDTMAASQAKSKEAVSLSEQAHEAFEQIKRSVDQITDMATQIASAAEEQHQVSEGINANIEAIHGAANEVNQVSAEVANNSSRQSALANKLTDLMKQFRV